MIIKGTSNIGSSPSSSGGGGSQLYKHCISIEYPTENAVINVEITNDNNTAFTAQTLKEWLRDNGFTRISTKAGKLATGFHYGSAGTYKTIIHNIYVNSSYMDYIYYHGIKNDFSMTSNSLTTNNNTCTIYDEIIAL